MLVAEDGSVLGRFNLYRFEDGTAELGYRVAQHVAGRGLATATVRELLLLAAARHGLRMLRAATSRENTASQKVLTKAGFVPVGPADPAHLGGKQGTWYQRDLSRRRRAAAACCGKGPDWRLTRRNRPATTSGRQPETGHVTIYGAHTPEPRLLAKVGALADGRLGAAVAPMVSIRRGAHWCAAPLRRRGRAMAQPCAPAGAPVRHRSEPGAPQRTGRGRVSAVR